MRLINICKDIIFFGILCLGLQIHVLGEGNDFTILARATNISVNCDAVTRLRRDHINDV